MSASSVQAQLFALQDPGFKAFQSKLIPTVNPDTVIGVRAPALRTLAKSLSGTPQAAAFLQQLPHMYYD
ncbi:MAG: DNA alkylation repair protein, partial [Clostridiales bacterium]|nr:DNA alkylation repair protein [Clostridiales bacterium]